MTEKEIFDKVISGLDSQDWEDTRDDYRYLYIDGNDCRSPLGWTLTDEEYEEYQGYSPQCYSNTSRITTSIPRLQKFGRLIFDLERAWGAKEWRDNYSGGAREYWGRLKEHRQAAIYDVGRLHGLLEDAQ